MQLISIIAFATCALAVPTQIDITITTDGQQHSTQVHNGNSIFEEPSCVSKSGGECKPWVEGQSCCPGLMCVTAYRKMICVEENFVAMSKIGDEEKECSPEWKIPDTDENHWLCHLGWDIGTPHACCDPQTSCQKLPYPPIPEHGFGWGCLPKKPNENAPLLNQQELGVASEWLERNYFVSVCRL
ncbi:hypothetical protein BKA61DRAFT_572753 [Leptodontidium sp. MPI-SDFR-AT-0119]|nr:hypothetical protein BKA61DRAFT_572753 [Leptodontidium sp. MPI-SDFR-AT-0119]